MDHTRAVPRCNAAEIQTNRIDNFAACVEADFNLRLATKQLQLKRFEAV